jgi:hypothetical protein
MYKRLVKFYLNGDMEMKTMQKNKNKTKSKYSKCLFFEQNAE